MYEGYLLIQIIFQQQSMRYARLRTIGTTIELKIGAEGRTRTGTALRHRPLKTACLPIPPLRLNRYFLTLSTGTGILLSNTRFCSGTNGCDDLWY